MINTIIAKLFHTNILQADNLFRSDIITSNIDIYALANMQSIILFNYKTKSYNTFNYNIQLSSLFEHKSQAVNLNHLNKKETLVDLKKIERYLDVINEQVHCQKTYIDKNFFFSLVFSYATNKGEEGCAIDFIPLLYNEKQELCYMLCKLEVAAHAGKPILKKYHATDNKTYEYLLSNKKFIENHKVNLSDIERIILRLSGEGKKEHEIANSLNLSLTNIKRYKSQIFEKMQVKSISEAIFIAYKRGQI